MAAPRSTDRRLVVGLGNPGSDAEQTPHNAGRRVTRVLIALLGARHGGDVAGSAVWTASRGGIEWTIAEPDTFMNESGPAVRALMAATGHRRGELVIVLDDSNLPQGAARFRASGSDGGHRGLRSILAALHSGEIARLRIGVGAAPAGVELGNFVLAPLPPAAAEQLDRVARRAAEALLANR
jgi:PTH1 family peptidyl-tRNA hydrolase